MVFLANIYINNLSPFRVLISVILLVAKVGKGYLYFYSPIDYIIVDLYLDYRGRQL